ncbi:MAG: HAD-IA family hydrolase [Nitrospirota bacterium]|nr:MAG: HAD-IA family hydrolase [Nitrospirota bacterium]
MSNSSIKVVYFDAAGTLFHIKGSVADVYLHYAEQYGIKPSPGLKQAVNAAFRQAFRDAPPPAFAVSKIEELKQCERLWWFDIVHAVFYRVGMFEGFDDYFEEVFEAFSGGRHWALYPETLSVLREIKSKGYELGIISNFDTRLFSILGELNLREYFDSITISSLARSAKPARQIFEYALSQHVIDPEEGLHVGDSVREDWEGARQANLKALLIDRDNDDSPRADCIRDLTELPSFLSHL